MKIIATLLMLFVFASVGYAGEIHFLCPAPICCLTVDDAVKIERMAGENDDEAMKKLLAAGRCLQWRTESAEESGVFFRSRRRSGGIDFIEIRRKGEVRSLWAPCYYFQEYIGKSQYKEEEPKF